MFASNKAMHDINKLASSRENLLSASVCFLCVCGFFFVVVFFALGTTAVYIHVSISYWRHGSSVKTAAV